MIKIINTDGITQGTLVLNEDGNEIKYIKNMVLSFEIDNYVKANIELVMPTIETKAMEKYIYPNLEGYENKYLIELKEEIEKELERRWLVWLRISKH